MINSLDDMDFVYEGLLELLRADELLKASFGGNRSEAGRYAANVRWQGNVKGEKKGRGNKSPLAQSILEANESLKKAGLTIRAIKITKRDTKLSKRLQDSVRKSSEKISKKLYASTGGNQDQWFIEAHNLMISCVSFEDTEFNYRQENVEGDFLILVEKGNQIVGAMKYRPAVVKEEFKDKAVGTIPYAGSFRVAKGVGTAMFGEALKIAAKTGTGAIKIEALNTAEGFWKSQGFKRVKGARLNDNSTYDMTLDASTVQTAVKEISS
jgi:hypothetical protein